MIASDTLSDSLQFSSDPRIRELEQGLLGPRPPEFIESDFLKLSDNIIDEIGDFRENNVIVPAVPHRMYYPCKAIAQHIVGQPEFDCSIILIVVNFTFFSQKITILIRLISIQPTESNVIKPKAILFVITSLKTPSSLSILRRWLITLGKSMRKVSLLNFIESVKMKTTSPASKARLTLKCTL